MEYKTFTKAVEAKTIKVKYDITRDPMVYKDFKDYWDDNKSGWKKGKYRNIIYRMIHYRDFISRDGDFIWRDFLFYSSPIFPVKMKAWFSYRRSLRQWKEVVDANVDELTEQIDKEILDEVMKMVEVDPHTGEVKVNWKESYGDFNI